MDTDPIERDNHINTMRIKTQQIKIKPLEDLLKPTIFFYPLSGSLVKNFSLYPGNFSG